MEGNEVLNTTVHRVIATRGENIASHTDKKSDTHSMKLNKLAHNAAATCRGGVLTSHIFFEAFDLLRKPAAVSAETRATEKQRQDEVREALTSKLDKADSLPESSENRGKDSQKEQEDISQFNALADLLNVDKFDMLESPKTDRKWKKVSKAVKEKTVVVAAAKTHVESVDPNDLLVFYFSAYRTSTWSVPSVTSIPLTLASVTTWSVLFVRCLTRMMQAKILAGA